MASIDTFTPTPLRISTTVVTANWGTSIDRDILFNHLVSQLIPIWYPDEGILKIEHKSVIYGASYKELFTHRKASSKSFFNQSTIVLRIKIGDGWKEVNMKLFANGGIQMTGVPFGDYANRCIQLLLDKIKLLPVSPFQGPVVVNKIQVSLINTDFSINMNIHQDSLQKILVEDYNIISTLEKTIYQGINMKYFYNKNNPDSGVCNCTTTCKGFGSGDGNGQCKRITISIFRTGKIIITGAMSMEQIQTAYRYICDILKTHSSSVLVHCV